MDITQNKISFSMEGEKLKGNFVLVRIKGNRGKLKVYTNTLIVSLQVLVSGSAIRVY